MKRNPMMPRRTSLQAKGSYVSIARDRPAALPLAMTTEEWVALVVCHAQPQGGHGLSELSHGRTSFGHATRSLRTYFRDRTLVWGVGG
jgi:hypothetical protein